MSAITDTNQLVAFSLGGEQYALPIGRVQEVIRYAEPRSMPSPDPTCRGVLSLRGRLIRVHDLGSLLGRVAEINDRTMIMVIETGGGTLGVVVESVDEVLTVGADDFEPVDGENHAAVESLVKHQERLIVLLDPEVLFAPAH